MWNFHTQNGQGTYIKWNWNYEHNNYINLEIIWWTLESSSHSYWRAKSNYLNRRKTTTNDEPMILCLYDPIVPYLAPSYIHFMVFVKMHNVSEFRMIFCYVFYHVICLFWLFSIADLLVKDSEKMHLQIICSN